MCHRSWSVLKCFIVKGMITVCGLVPRPRHGGLVVSWRQVLALLVLGRRVSGLQRRGQRGQRAVAQQPRILLLTRDSTVSYCHTVIQCHMTVCHSVTICHYRVGVLRAEQSEHPVHVLPTREDARHDDEYEHLQHTARTVLVTTL